MSSVCRAGDPPPSPLFLKRLECPKVRLDAATESEEECCRTPTAEEFRIPAVMKCPPAPMKRPSLKSSRSSSDRVKFFVTPPNLNLIFALEKASEVN